MITDIKGHLFILLRDGDLSRAMRDRRTLQSADENVSRLLDEAHEQLSDPLFTSLHPLFSKDADGESLADEWSGLTWLPDDTGWLRDERERKKLSCIDPLRFKIDYDQTLDAIDKRYEERSHHGYGPREPLIMFSVETTAEEPSHAETIIELGTRSFDEIDCLYLYATDIDCVLVADMFFWSGVGLFHNWHADVGIIYEIQDTWEAKYDLGINFMHELNMIDFSFERSPLPTLFATRAPASPLPQVAGKRLRINSREYIEDRSLPDQSDVELYRSRLREIARRYSDDRES